ncbi:hypothetical protein JAAARDRAFT_28976 [Jaapia argillacea MUCL 33604]|uniref:UBA domain-containing protein n=1 Tax=Jaapia argillacea MUCL 33604 TaxID=933084 RepID=A0A067QA16_9AGAM|nr:hypothetical protein JAAARDRAFT_28976 [Jaapia argillacea MUCL 33604]
MSDSPSDSKEIQINIKGPNELKLQISISTDKSVSELKQAIAEKSEVEAGHQRLIYSGRVLQDDDPLSQYKIQTNHTIHMVKSARPAGAPSSSGPGSSSAPAQQLPTMQTGMNPHDPLAQLNSHMGFGAMAGLNPFADMGLNPNDPNMLQTMMNSPEFLQQMAATMSNPAILDQMLASNPQLAGMGPQVREIFQSERFRQMISNPETLRSMLEMARLMRGTNPSAGGLGGLGGMGGLGGLGGLGGGMFGGAGGGGGFPAPGVPGGAASNGTGTTGGAGTGAGADAGAGAGTTTGAGAGLGGFGGLGGAGAGGLPPIDPAMLQHMQQLFGGMGVGGGAGSPGLGSPGAGAGAGGFGGLGGPGAGGFGGLGGWGGWGGGYGGAGAGAAASPPPAADTRSPEERFQVQLQQLQDMGFTNASQNVRALLATGGNVHSAIEYILGGGGL